jgi:hypothetical protein
MVVDLGPDGALSSLNLSRGVRLGVKGSLVAVRGRPVLVAHELRVGDSKRSISRPIQAAAARLATAPGKTVKAKPVVDEVDDTEPARSSSARDRGRKRTSAREQARDRDEEENDDDDEKDKDRDKDKDKDKQESDELED